MALIEGDYKNFNTEDFIKNNFPLLYTQDTHIFSDFLLKCLVRHYNTIMSSAAQDSLKILDYGCGPSIPYSISAAPKASEIVLADYAQPNRECLQKWLARDPSAIDWSPYFKYVVQTLEGGSDEEATQREEVLRKKIKAVVPCNISKDQIIEDGYQIEAAYDVVSCFLCLECGCKDNDSYKRAIKNLTSKLKDGGYLLLYHTQINSNVQSYRINKTIYRDIALKKEFVLDTLKENGLSVREEAYQACTVKEDSYEGLLYIAAYKA